MRFSTQISRAVSHAARIGRRLDLWRDGAFQTWSQAAGILRNELGADPSTDLQHLHHAMLRRDRREVQPLSTTCRPDLALERLAG